MLHTIESVRAQVDALASQIANDPVDGRPFVPAAIRSSNKFLGVERNIIDPAHDRPRPG